ncbi:MAG: TonB-dependent receptor domain-containing protein [Parcubacteria group bacterium]
MTFNRRWTRSILLGATALTGALTLSATQASAQERRYDFDVPAQPLNAALQTFARQAQLQVIFAEAETKSLRAPPLNGSYSADEALQVLLAGTQLKASRNNKGVLQVAVNADPQSGSAAGDGAEVEALIVTAQKREEDIQDVPIAMSAFSQEDLTRSQVATGADLMTQVPNMTFTKTNFSGYSIQIRGIGTQAISATVDPAVAVAFNNTPFIRNRFFEQEFYDLQRIEVLRGPQGTLYGRNATAGVVNILSAKPNLAEFQAKVSADVANYKSTRLEGMVNIPIVEDIAALRLAAAWTKREGFVDNEITDNPIDGRDLWSARVSLRFEPTDWFSANLIYEHFQEDDDRLRSGKQLCHRDPGVYGLAEFSGGCKPGSLYSPEAFGVPNGFTLPYYHGLQRAGLPVSHIFDAYVSQTQSTDLRVIESTVDPHYKADSDLGEIQISVDLDSGLTLTSETGYNRDFIFSTQDFNRFNTAPGAFVFNAFDRLQNASNNPTAVDENGVFCDPQVGCADRIVVVDLSTAKSTQFSQEFRLASGYDGPFNFSLGANFLRYDTEDKYYVFFNTISLYAALPGWFSTVEGTVMPPYVGGQSDNQECLRKGMVEGVQGELPSVFGCIYIDPNPIEHLNDLGHNYFLSKNPYKLLSYAVFGEAYYELAQNLKVTAGLRWTVDKKQAPRIPSWLLAANTVGYPVSEVVEQEWRQPSGRLAIDWKPDLSITDETLIYASYAHGYKAGGANPPPANIATAFPPNDGRIQDTLIQPRTFDPEFVDAYEMGSKNTLFDGKLTLNLATFYYNYKDYQISQIINRSAVNYNFDARIWGLELEADWRPLENLRLGLKAGYQDTRIADGEQAIDIMDRTAGDPNWIVARPFATIPSNCILPRWFADYGITDMYIGDCTTAYLQGKDPATGDPYQPNPPADTIDKASHQYYSHDGVPYPGFDPLTAPNNGEGIFTDLSGHQLPNAPHYTGTLTADYTLPLPRGWLATLHTDFYYQSEAWSRVFNLTGYDRLKAYYNLNLAAIFSNEDAGWTVMAYIKNALDADNITGSFLNSDDTGLTTNVFLNEPRLYGIRVTKQWSGQPWWTNVAHPAGEPWPVTLEVGGSVQRFDAANEVMAPGFVDGFPDTLNPLSRQGDDLDRGDGRELKLTYRPGGAWSLSAGVRYGRANHSGRDFERNDADPICYAAGTPFESSICGKYFPPGDEPFFTPTIYANNTVTQREDHTLVDFAVGRDFAIGGLDRSELGFDLRIADIGSRTEALISGLPEWVFGQYPWLAPSQHHIYDAELIANRDFTGAGPVLRWEADKTAFASDRSRLALTWALEGGVLFGRQKTQVEGEINDRYFNQKYLPPAMGNNTSGRPWPRVPNLVTSTPVNLRRSESTTVPTAVLSLGLAWEADRFKVSTGYRWERYFNAVDGGFEEHKDYDRTIDGPYFKVSVGFGG